jgi:hypothetical protein
LKLRIFIFALAILAAGSILAEENDALPSRTSTAAEAGFNLDYTNDRMTGRAIGDRSVDLLGLFDSSDSGQSTRYNVSLELENEDSDWSFEVTVTMEF